jgi:two-component system sensor histidine kinase BaeS
MRPPRLAARLFAAQVVVVATGIIGLTGAALLAGPGLFHEHMMRAAMTGIGMPEMRAHAEDAFTSSFAFAVTVGATASLAVAAGVAWFTTRRIALPIEDLARAADRVATTRHASAEAPDASRPLTTGFAEEIDHLTVAFTAMADRLAATDRTRTRLLADLAHELRTPLGTLEAYVDGIEDGILVRDAAAWEVMRAQIRRMRRLASDLRDVAAAADGAMAVAPVTAAVEDLILEAVRAVEPRFIAKGVELRAGPIDAHTVDADAVRLQQVLGNLLDNALRHVAPGGHVTVSASRSTHTTEIRVVDDGVGIDAEHLDVIFERFRRIDPARATHEGSGGGLGLTIARAIVESHGGTLIASSDGLGRGATFTVSLPTRRPIPPRL